MPAFKYKALSPDGVHVSGVIEAFDEFAAVEKIRETCPVVSSIAEVKPRFNPLTVNLFGGQIKYKPLSLMCSQFSIILKAGLPLVRAVELIAGQTTEKDLKKLLLQVAEDVAAGYGLAASFENKGKKLLPTTFIETLRAGEESGTLEISFHKLFLYFDKAQKVKSKVKSAMIYPIFLLVLAVAVVALIMVVVMPVFTEMFGGMGVEMPGVTLVLIGISTFFSNYWALVLVVIVAIAIVLKYYSTRESGRLRFAKMQLRLPALGKVARMKGASQLANTMSTLLASGLPMIRTVAVTARVLDNYHLSLQLGGAVSGLEEGRRLGDCLRDCGCFPDMLVEMAAVGEESGSLEETLDTIGAYYDEEVAVATQKALSMLQPAITVGLGAVIGFIVIALYLPMFTMYSGM